MDISGWTIAIIFVKEWWDNTYSAGLFLFSLHCDLVPERTYCQLIAVSYQHKAPYLKGSVYILSWLWKVPGNKTFLWRSAFEERLSLFRPLFPTWIRFPWDGLWGPFLVIWNVFITQSGLIPGDIPCPPSLLSFFEPAILHVGSTNLRE